MKRALTILLFPLAALAYSHTSGPLPGGGVGHAAAPAAVPDNTRITSATKDLQFKVGDLGPSEQKASGSIWRNFQKGPNDPNNVDIVPETDVPNCDFVADHAANHPPEFKRDIPIDVVKVVKKVKEVEWKKGQTKPFKVGTHVVDVTLFFRHNGNRGKLFCTFFTNDPDRDFTYGDLRRAFGKPLAFQKYVGAARPLNDSIEQEWLKLDTIRDAYAAAQTGAEKAGLETDARATVANVGRMIAIQSENARLYNRLNRAIAAEQLPDAKLVELEKYADELQESGNLSRAFKASELPGGGMQDSLEKQIASGQAVLNAKLTALQVP